MEEREPNREVLREEPVILGFPRKEELIREIEAQMRPGELVVIQKGIRHEAYVAQMGTNRLDNNLIIAQAPTYVISGTGFQSDVRVLRRKDQPILLSNHIFPFSENKDRVMPEGIMAIGNQAVCRFFSDYGDTFFYYPFKSQKDFLRVVQELGLREEEVFRQLQGQVADKIIQRLFSRMKDNISNWEGIDEFARLIGNKRGISEILSDLVDYGLLDLDLKVTFKMNGGKEEVSLSVDEVFNQLACHCQPPSVPARIYSNEEWREFVRERKRLGEKIV